MIKPNQNCRIVPHPSGMFHPKEEAINKLVRTVGPAEPPKCGHLKCMFTFLMMEATDGPLWDCTALQTIGTVQTGRVMIVPEKNLAPLPDVDDDKEDEVVNAINQIQTKELERV